MIRTPHDATDTSIDIDIDQIRQRLMAERAELLGTLSTVGEDATVRRSDVPDGIGETEHLVSAERQDVSSRVLALTRHALDEVDEALARLDDGTYGDCIGCGAQISPDRLDAIPAASCCVACQSSREGIAR
jgi:RNA polymerase-binding transcription factor DksA